MCLPKLSFWRFSYNCWKKSFWKLACDRFMASRVAFLKRELHSPWDRWWFQRPAFGSSSQCNSTEVRHSYSHSAQNPSAAGRTKWTEWTRGWVELWIIDFRKIDLITFFFLNSHTLSLAAHFILNLEIETFRAFGRKSVNLWKTHFLRLIL